MKKYMIVGAGLVAIVALFAWNGKESNETNVEQNEIASSNEVLFSSEQVTEKLQRIQIMLKAIKLPEILPFEPRYNTLSAASLLEDTIVTNHYTMDEKQEIVLSITAENPIQNQAEYEKIEVEEQVAWLLKSKNEIKLTMENEGLYYTLKSAVSSQEELESMLSSLEETTFDTHMDFKGLVFPTYFPSEVLAVQEVRYTKGTEESLQVTYVTKEEYGDI